MTRNDIAASICRNHPLSKSIALSIVEDVLDSLAVSFVRGENTNFRGFGTFEVMDTAEKKARNINTGATVIVPAGRTVKFRPCKELKNRMNNGNVD